MCSIDEIPMKHFNFSFSDKRSLKSNSFDATAEPIGLKPMVVSVGNDF